MTNKIEKGEDDDSRTKIEERMIYGKEQLKEKLEKDNRR